MPNAPRRPGSEQPAPVNDGPAVIDPLAYNWLVALGIMTIGAIAGMLFLHYRNPPEIGPAVSLGAFAGVFLLAAADERVLEALVHFQLLGAEPAARRAPPQHSARGAAPAGGRPGHRPASRGARPC